MELSAVQYNVLENLDETKVTAHRMLRDIQDSIKAYPESQYLRLIEAKLIEISALAYTAKESATEDFYHDSE